MSVWTGGHHYTLWEQEDDGNWVKSDLSFLSFHTVEQIIEQASAFVGARPTQLMRVLPSGHERVALWIDKVQVPITTIP